MNKKILLISCLVVFVLAGTFYFKSVAEADVNESTPGLADDPIVTKSYVDKKVAELVAAELEKIGAGGGQGTGTMAQLEVVNVALGQKLTIAAGGELIVRTGKAIAFSSDTNGLSDMTDGLDIKPGAVVGNNHLILFPRDGRGVHPDPKGKVGLTVLVRGGYTLK
ncbi:hypothetical protein [Cohnella faecalis]